MTDFSKDRFKKLAGLLTEQTRHESYKNLVARLEGVEIELEQKFRNAPNSDVEIALRRALESVQSALSEVEKLDLKRDVRSVAEDNNYLYTSRQFRDAIEMYGVPDEVSAEEIVQALQDDGRVDPDDYDSYYKAVQAAESYVDSRDF